MLSFYFRFLDLISPLDILAKEENERISDEYKLQFFLSALHGAIRSQTIAMNPRSLKEASSMAQSLEYAKKRHNTEYTHIQFNSSQININATNPTTNHSKNHLNHMREITNLLTLNFKRFVLFMENVRTLQKSVKR